MDNSRPRRHRRAALAVLMIATLTVAGATSAAADPPAPAFAFGFGEQGTGDGQFSEGGAVAVADDGTLYVTDTINDRVQVFDADGTYVDQFGTFDYPNDITFDDEGHLLIAALGGSQVHEVETDGTPVAAWGSFGTDDGQFRSLSSIDVDADGNVYVADADNHRVQKFAADGTYLDQWGVNGDGDGEFSLPRGLHVGPDGNVYVADTGNNRIQVFAPDGTYLEQWATGGTSPFSGPWDIAFEPSGDAVALFNDHLVEGFAAVDHAPTWSLPTSGSAITHVTSADGRLYVTDFDTIDVYDIAAPSMTVTKSAVDDEISAFETIEWQIEIENTGNVTLTDLAVSDPTAPDCERSADPVAPGETVTVGPCSQPTTEDDVGTVTNVATVSSAETAAVASNQATVTVGEPPFTVAVTAEPTDVPTGGVVGYHIEVTNDLAEPLTDITIEAPGASGCDGQVMADIAVAATGALDCTGQADFADVPTLTTTVTVQTAQGLSAGQAEVTVTAPAPPVFVADWDDTATDLSVPSGVAFGPDGDAFVGDRAHVVHWVDESGTFVDSWPTGGSGTGSFDELVDVATDADGNVFVIDSSVDQVQKFSPTGTLLTSWGTTGSANGQLNVPSSVAVTPAGNVVVADVLNSRIQEFTPTGAFVRKITVSFPISVAVGPGGDLYTATAFQPQVEHFAADGQELAGFAEPPGGWTGVIWLTTAPNGDVFVAHPGESATEWYTSDGVLRQRLNLFHDGVGLDAGGRRIVAMDAGSATLREYAFPAAPAVATDASVDQAAVSVGQAIDYHLTVHNPGNVTLTGVTITAPDAADCAGPVADIRPTRSVTVDCTRVPLVGDVGTYALDAEVDTAQTDPAAFSVADVAVAHRRRSDGQIRVGNGAFAGTTTYNLTGANQSRTATVGNRGTATFTVRVQNDGTAADTFRIKGLGSTNRFTVTYRNGATNVTNQVVAGTFQYASVAPGATRNLTVVIQARTGTPRNAAITRLVTVTSPTPTAVKDVVKATVTRR